MKVAIVHFKVTARSICKFFLSHSRLDFWDMYIFESKQQSSTQHTGYSNCCNTFHWAVLVLEIGEIWEKWEIVSPILRSND